MEQETALASNFDAVFLGHDTVGATSTHPRTTAQQTGRDRFLVDAAFLYARFGILAVSDERGTDLALL
jgi:hypothetical protein